MNAVGIIIAHFNLYEFSWNETDLISDTDNIKFKLYFLILFLILSIILHPNAVTFPSSKPLIYIWQITKRVKY